MNLLIHPTQELYGSTAVPGDKSISHRAAMFAALAEGRSHVRNFLPGGDCQATLGVLRAWASPSTEVSPSELLHRRRGAARPARAGRAAGLRQLRHDHAADGRPAGRAALLQRAQRQPPVDQAPHGPRRRAAAPDGRSDPRPARGQAGPAGHPGSAAARHRLYACPWPAPRSSRPLLLAGPVQRRPDRRAPARPGARPHRAHAGAMGAPLARAGLCGDQRAAQAAADAAGHGRAGRHLLGCLSAGGRAAGPRVAPDRDRRGRQPDPHRASWTSCG